MERESSCVYVVVLCCFACLHAVWTASSALSGATVQTGLRASWRATRDDGLLHMSSHSPARPPVPLHQSHPEQHFLNHHRLVYTTLYVDTYSTHCNERMNAAHYWWREFLLMQGRLLVGVGEDKGVEFPPAKVSYQFLCSPVCTLHMLC